MWDNKVFRGPNGRGATIYQGPWPWLTAICPDLSNDHEFGNKESFRPIPGNAQKWQPYQYAETCGYTPDSSGKVHAECSREHPEPPVPGAFTGAFCPGGENYTYGNDCLRIPAQRAGGSLKLRGFNFITPTVTVRLQRVGDPGVASEQVCIVWGDTATPLKDASDHFMTAARRRC